MKGFAIIGLVAFTLGTSASAQVPATTFQNLAADPSPAAGEVWYLPGAFRLAPVPAARFTLSSSSAGNVGVIDFWSSSAAPSNLILGPTVRDLTVGSFDVGFTYLDGRFVAVRCRTTDNQAPGGTDPSPGGCDFNLDDKRLIRLTHDVPGIGAGRYIAELGDSSDKYVRTLGRWLGDLNWAGDDGNHRVQVDAAPLGVPGRRLSFTAGQGGDGARGGDLQLDAGAPGSGSTGGYVLVGTSGQSAGVTVGHMLSSTRLDGAVDVPATGRLSVAGHLLMLGVIEGNLHPSSPAGGRVGTPTNPWWGAHTEGSEGLSVNRIGVDALQLRYGTSSMGAGYQVRSTGPAVIVSSPSYAVVSGSIARLIPVAGGFSDIASTAGASVVRVTDDGRLGLYGAVPVARPTAAGQPGESSTGGIGSTAYTLGDIVRAAKLVGLVTP